MPVIFPTHCCYRDSFGNQEAETLTEFYQCSFIVKHATVVWDACINGPWTQWLSLWCFVSWSSVWRLPHEIKWFHESCCHLNSNTRPFERMAPHRSTLATGASRLRRLWQDNSWSRWGLTLTSASSFAFYASACWTKEERSIRKSYSSTPIQKHNRSTPPLLHVQVNISKGPSELIADITKKKKKTEQRDINWHWR